MPYKFAKERPDYSDLASGRVFYSLPGHPAFPIRLADEIIQRCLVWRETNQMAGPCVLYDPCCGAAYHLTILAYLYWHSFRTIIGSDIEGKAVRVAQQNLDLLTVNGLDKRKNELSERLRLYGKESHQEALNSTYRLRSKIADLANNHPLRTAVFQANVLDGDAVHRNLKGTAVDIVFTDVPYGVHSHWHYPQTLSASGSPLKQMLDTLAGILTPASIVALVSDKGQRVAHEGYQRVEQFQMGKRRVLLLRPIS